MPAPGSPIQKAIYITELWNPLGNFLAVFEKVIDSNPRNLSIEISRSMKSEITGERCTLGEINSGFPEA
jgi:hypothetical protein